jgi:hypothetical protein
VKSLHAQFVEQLGVNEMHLAQIGLRRIARDARAVLDAGTHMRVALDPQTFAQNDLRANGLSTSCAPARADADHARAHEPGSL